MSAKNVVVLLQLLQTLEPQPASNLGWNIQILPNGAAWVMLGNKGNFRVPNITSTQSVCKAFASRFDQPTKIIQSLLNEILQTT